MNQKQHIIPEIYLKQFGYRTKNGTWKVSTFNVNEINLMNRIGKPLIRQSNIKSLLQEVNIYDIPVNEKDKLLLENFFNITENHYQEVIEEIRIKQMLSSDKRDKLLGFIAMLFVRTKDYRMILDQVIERRDLNYINNIFQSFEGFNGKIETLFELPKDMAINFLIAFSGSYIFNCLKDFTVKIIKPIPERKWATTDTPVLVSCKVIEQKGIDFMGIDSIIICPLSPEFLCYIEHKDSKVRRYEGTDILKENLVGELPIKSLEIIMKDLIDMSRINQYLINPNWNPEQKI